MYALKIPKARVACLIGKNGNDKRLIERNTETRIVVSSEGDVEIFGEGLNGYLCEKIVKAIGRGFRPDVAMELIQDDYGLEIIDIKPYCGDSRKKMTRITGRLIGSNGKARRIIEKLTGCSIRVYGKTVSIIGESERIGIAFHGIEKLLQGSPHGNVYGYLEREMKRLMTPALKYTRPFHSKNKN